MSRLQDTDRDWERFGETDPYWAVLTDDRFRRKNLSAQALEEFYRTGEHHVESVLASIRSHVDADFAPASALDFGCGVGRLVVALAKTCQRVVGVDVSDHMLAEARAQCESRGLTNVRFVKGDDDLSQVREKFDLVHSFLVMQHIPTARGERLFERLVERMNDDAVGVIHVTYAVGAPPRDRGLPPAARRPLALRIPVGLARRGWRLGRRLLRPALRVLTARGAAAQDEPRMQMNDYSLSRLVRILQLSGVRRVHLELLDHVEHFAAVLYFQRTPPSDS